MDNIHTSRARAAGAAALAGVLATTACAAPPNAASSPLRPSGAACIGIEAGAVPEMAIARLTGILGPIDPQSAIGIFQNNGPRGSHKGHTNIANQRSWGLIAPNPETGRSTTFLCAGAPLPFEATGYDSATSIGLDQAGVPLVEPVCESVRQAENTAMALRRVSKRVEKNPLYDAAYFRDHDGVLLWGINWKGNIYLSPEPVPPDTQVCVDNRDDFYRRPKPTTPPTNPPPASKAGYGRGNAKI